MLPHIDVFDNTLQVTCFRHRFVYAQAVRKLLSVAVSRGNAQILSLPRQSYLSSTIVICDLANARIRGAVNAAAN